MPGTRDGPKAGSSSPGRSLGVGARRPDAIVIGSGFGGSVSAARLAERGLEVLVLERGPWWGQAAPPAGVAGRAYPRGPWGVRKAVRSLRWARGRRSRCVLLNRDGLLELHLFDRLTGLTASGVGGGSLVYADVLMQPDDGFFDYLPAELTAAEMAPYYQRVRETLQPSPLPERPPRTAAFERAVAAAGLPAPQHPDLAVAWPPGPDAGSAGPASSFLLGCAYAGKRSLDKTYLPLALRRGAQVRSLSEVVALERAGTGYRVHWLDHTARRRWWAEAPLVVVAAGTFGTLRLLFAARDRDRSLALPPTLGHRFSVGGDMLALLDGAPDAQDSPYGPCPGAGVLVAQHGDHRFLILEAGAPTDALPLPGAARRRLSGPGLFGMGRDASSGVIEFDGRELRTGTDRSLDPELFAQIQAALTQIAQGYRPRRVRVLPPGGPDGRQRVTVHPMGGAAIADGPEAGVVDHTGQVFGNPGLYIADASLFPRAPGFPPAMTIAALAERQATLIGEPAVSAIRQSSKGPAPWRP